MPNRRQPSFRRPGDACGLRFQVNIGLGVPLPVPTSLFWSVTVYDPDTRSEIVTDQDNAALRSMFELKGKTGESIDLYFGPDAPSGHEGEWIKTIPGQGWFVYLRLYGPQEAAFNGSWKPGNFEAVAQPMMTATNAAAAMA
jgi:hypothetical protein